MAVGPGITELVIANVAEAFLPLFVRYVAQGRYAKLVHDEARLGDRCLFWKGERKLVISSYPAEHASYVSGAELWGTVINVAPRHPSGSICDDVLRESDVFERVVTLLAGERAVRLVAYVASGSLFKLVEALRSRDVRLHLAETPAPDAVRRAKTFDTKSGFRRLAESWCRECPELKLPSGEVAGSIREAASIAVRRLGAGVACVCKADIGAAGLGLLWLQPQQQHSHDSVKRMLIAEPAFGDDPIAVEDWIHLSPSVPREHVSPSVEAQVSLDGRVTVTYVSGQTLGPRGNFTGVVIDYRGLPRPLIDQMERVAAFVGSRLAEFGYAGYFDIDFVIGQDLELYAVEGNLRRTGGTHAHESASAVLGASYMEHSAVLSRDDILMAPLPGGWAQLKERIDDLLVSPSSRTRGVVPTVVTDIWSGRVGYVLLAESRAEAAGLERVLLDRIGAVRNA